VDTVPFGCYKKELFERIGTFDEDLVRNQDDELNSRLIKAGGKIFLVPEIKIDYIARATLRGVWRMYWQYGYFKPLAIKKVGTVVTIRQLVPGAFVLSLGLCAILALFHPLASYALLAISSAYLLASLFASVLVAKRFGPALVLVCPIVFAAVHFAFGAGFLRGVGDFFGIRARTKVPRPEEIPISR
jgi:hypothetical protein